MNEIHLGNDSFGNVSTISERSRSVLRILKQMLRICCSSLRWTTSTRFFRYGMASVCSQQARILSPFPLPLILFPFFHPVWNCLESRATVTFPWIPFSCLPCTICATSLSATSPSTVQTLFALKDWSNWKSCALATTTARNNYKPWRCVASAIARSFSPSRSDAYHSVPSHTLRCTISLRFSHLYWTTTVSQSVLS